MAIAVRILDESLPGGVTNSFTLEDLNEVVTARELIRARIYQEVQDHNRAGNKSFTGLVQPLGAERILNGIREKVFEPIDWEKQYEIACKAFTGNGFFILFEERQLESLDEVVHLKVGSEVSFVKLIPLVGG